MNSGNTNNVSVLGIGNVGCQILSNLETKSDFGKFTYKNPHLEELLEEKGKNNADRAPITIFILLLLTPFQIISLFFFEALECQIAGFMPKKLLSRALNCSVNAISGNKINTCVSSCKISLILSKYTIVLPDPVTP